MGKTKTNTVEVRQLLELMEKLYSGALLSTGPKVKGLIEHDGKQWVSTGGAFGQCAKLQRVVPRQEWTGEVFESPKPHGTYTPETFYTGRLVRHRGQEWVMMDVVLTITAESGADEQTYAGTPACADGAGKPATQSAPTLEKGKPLPDGIPEEIEVDVGGRTARWKQAHVVGVVSGKLICQFVGGRRLKTPVSGKDISWRVPLAA